MAGIAEEIGLVDGDGIAEVHQGRLVFRVTGDMLAERPEGLEPPPGQVLAQLAFEQVLLVLGQGDAGAVVYEAPEELEILTGQFAADPLAVWLVKAHPSSPPA